MGDLDIRFTSVIQTYQLRLNTKSMYIPRLSEARRWEQTPTQGRLPMEISEDDIFFRTLCFHVSQAQFMLSAE
jgi:hypothetical protein